MNYMSPTSRTRNADAVAEFVASTVGRPLPPEVIDAAKFCLVDWLGVAVGAHREPAAIAVRRTVDAWRASGKAQVILGGRTTPVAAALINGTMAHCLDFDDTHVGSIAHISGPTWAAALAVGMERDASPQEMLTAFVIGFEVGAHLGSDRLGVALNERGIHSTGIVGCFGAAAAAGALYRLDAEGMKRALGAAATQAAGLTGSFGTMAKPFHTGKAAFNGILAAQLAAEGFESATDLLEEEDGLSAALVQDGAATVREVDFARGWEITRNTFKPYASCLLTHPVIDAGRQLFESLGGRNVERVTVHVHPLAIQLAGKPNPRTPLEGKFSTAYCVALALNGHPASPGDFAAERLEDPAVRDIVGKVELVPTPEMEKTAARVELRLADGERLDADIPLALGNPERPMSWDDMRLKFTALVEPALGAKTAPLFEHLRRFEAPEDLAGVIEAVARPAG